MDCFSAEKMIEGLKAGKPLMVDRVDAPELPELLALVLEGHVDGEIIKLDEQSNVLRFKWRS